MADWSNIADSALDPDAPLTSEIAYGWRDNPIAIAEGAPGAPRVQGRSMDIDLGSLSGTTAITGIANANKVYITARSVVSVGADSDTPVWVGYQTSSNNGSTWDATVELTRTVTRAGSPFVATGSGSRMVSMVGKNAIRLQGSGTVSGEVIWIEGQG